MGDRWVKPIESVLTQPFQATVVLSDDQGHELFRFDAGTIRPGDTVRFDYPAGGLPAVLS